MTNKIVQTKNDEVVITLNNVNRTCSIDMLQATRSGTSNISELIIDLSEKTGCSADEMRSNILLPMAKLTEDYYPGRISWFETFKEVEKNLNETADSNFQEEKQSAYKNMGIDVDDNIDAALDDKIKAETDSPENDIMIKEYLKKWELPLWAA